MASNPSWLGYKSVPQILLDARNIVCHCGYNGPVSCSKCLLIVIYITLITLYIGWTNGYFAVIINLFIINKKNKLCWYSGEINRRLFLEFTFKVFICNKWFIKFELKVYVICQTSFNLLFKPQAAADDVRKDDLQLVAITSIFIASKSQEIFLLGVR